MITVMTLVVAEMIATKIQQTISEGEGVFVR